MFRFCGMNRYVWNYFLTYFKQVKDAGGYANYYKMAAHLTILKKYESTSFLKEAYSQSLQRTLRDLDRALTAAFDKNDPKRFPVFHRKGKHQNSFCVPQGYKIDSGNSRIYIPKVGWMRYRKHREIDGMPKEVWITEKNGKWYISVSCIIDVVPIGKHEHFDSPVGIDRGVRKLAALSTGEIVEAINALKKHEDKLARLQRKLARQVRGSGRYRNTKLDIARLHEKIANTRKDYLHKATATITKTHGIVFVEDLRVANMTASAKGTVESPGKCVKQKSGLNRSILDQGWGIFERQLDYKLMHSGGILIKVPTAYTSQTCSECGCIDSESRLSQSDFVCTSCGHAENADVNAAKNILAKGLLSESFEKAAGHAVSGCGGLGSSRPVKRQPPDAA